MFPEKQAAHIPVMLRTTRLIIHCIIHNLFVGAVLELSVHFNQQWRKSSWLHLHKVCCTPVVNVPSFTWISVMKQQAAQNAGSLVKLHVKYSESAFFLYNGAWGKLCLNKSTIFWNTQKAHNAAKLICHCTHCLIIGDEPWIGNARRRILSLKHGEIVATWQGCFSSWIWGQCQATTGTRSVSYAQFLSSTRKYACMVLWKCEVACWLVVCAKDIPL